MISRTLATTAVAALALIAAAGTGAQATAGDTYPPVDDLVPADATLTTGYEQYVATGAPPGFEDSTDSYRDYVDLYVGTDVPDSYEYVHPDAVVVTIRSTEPTDTWDILGTTQSTPPADDPSLVSFGTIGSDEPVTVTLTPELVGTVRVRANQHGQFTVLTQQQFAHPDVPDAYTAHPLAFGYSRGTQLASTDGQLEVYATNYQATGHAMELTWFGEAVSTATEATITVGAPDGWTIFTGNGAATTSPVTVAPDLIHAQAGAVIFVADEAGDYPVTLTVGDSTVTLTLRADDGTFPWGEYYPVPPPSSDCLPHSLPGPGTGLDAQLLVNGLASNDLVVNAGEPVTVSWPATELEGRFETFANLIAVWGPSAWTADGPTVGVPIPAGGTADMTLTFQGAGCNLIRMDGGTGDSRFAYLRVQEQQPPAAPATPAVTIDKKVATITWQPVDTADAYTITVDGLEPITTSGTSTDIDLSDLAKGRTKELPATLVASNEAGSSTPVEFTISLTGSGKPSPGDHPGKGHGKPNSANNPDDQIAEL